MQVIGLCRFSYPAIGGFQVGHDDIAAREAFLYAPSRMEARFRSFECLTLASLKAQTDPDFTLVILIGENLPAQYRARLEALITDIPQAVVQAHPPRRHRQVCRDVINSVRSPGDAPCLQFRMDDDDAVACSFVADLRDVAARAAALLELDRHVAIDFNHGFVARADAHGLQVEPVIRPFWTPALGLMIRAGETVSIMNFSHAKLPRRMPCVSVPAPDMFVRGHDGYNDSRQTARASAPDLSPLDAEGEAMFRAQFGIDAAHVRAVYGR